MQPATPKIHSTMTHPIVTLLLTQLNDPNSRLVWFLIRMLRTAQATIGTQSNNNTKPMICGMMNRMILSEFLFQDLLRIVSQLSLRMLSNS